MRSLLILLLAGCLAGSYARELSQVSATCPVDNCATTIPGACATVNGVWQCKTCVAPRVPNAKKNACVCPAGMFPAASGECKPCKKNFYCPKGNDPLVSTAKACPVNMVTSKTGAKTLADCLNAPGFYYQRKSATVVRALPCPDNTYSKGLDKAPTCTPCMTGFKTDPENAAGTHTSSAVCVAPPGYFVSGETVVLCPKGEYQEQYAFVTSCKACADTVGDGVTTPAVGSTSASDCKWPEQGYMLLDSGGKAVWTSSGAAVGSIQKVTGARACPQGYFCIGGDPKVNGNNTAGTFPLGDTKSAGIPQQCPRSLTTEKEGAYSIDQCVAPPGKYGDLSTTVTDCPSGTYKEAYARASTPADGCVPCGTGLWLSEKNYRVAYTDIYGQLLRQELVRGSSDSCYIQKGMGTERTLTTNALNAIICPKNTYGVIGDASKGLKYGQVHTPCTACPANMITGYVNDNTAQADSIKYLKALPAATTVELLSGAYTEGNTTITISDGTSATTGSGSGYFHVKACTNRPGYGYYNGASQKCPQGFFNAGGNDLPCQQCAPGTTTNGTEADQASEDDCRMLAPGYTLNGLTDSSPVLCPVGTFSIGNILIADIQKQYQLDSICQPCPAGRWTLEPGAYDATACTLCAPGWGGVNYTSCASCQLGEYGPASRSTTPCLTCPEATRTFTYAWPSENVDTFYPAVTSPQQAKGLEDCVADFAQISNGAFFLDLLDGSCNLPTVDVVNGDAILNLQSCVAACAVDADCAAATFDYYLAQEAQFAADGSNTPNNKTCKLWKPVHSSGIANGGIGLKTMPAYNLALSKAKDMGSGYYTQWMGASAAACLNSASLVTVSAKSTIQECFDACTEVNECAGVVFENATAVAVACKLIMAKIEPGDSRRTLVKAVPLAMAGNCTAGQRKKADDSGCEACPAGEYWDETFNFGYSCKICLSPKVVTFDKKQCIIPVTSCLAGTEFNPTKPDECQPCRAGTFKYWNDTDGISRKCENCTYTVSTDKTKCQREASCSRGYEWALNDPGHCVPCEKDNYYKDTADEADLSPSKCIECPTVGSAKWTNDLAVNREHCINNCDAGWYFDDTNTTTRKDPTKCQKCPWPLVKSGPAPTACLEFCDVRNGNLSLRTTPNSDRSKCITPVVCGRNEEFDKEFPEDVMKCKPCPARYQNDDGVWLCVQPLNMTNNTAANCGNGSEVNPNALQDCHVCPLPLYADDALGECTLTCGTQTTSAAANAEAVFDIGRNLNDFTYYYDGRYCQQQCGVDQIWDYANKNCTACNSGGIIEGSVRKHGQVILDACTTCVNATSLPASSTDSFLQLVAWMGYCVQPVQCPINAQYDPLNPLDVEKCTPCPANFINTDGWGRCEAYVP